MKGRRTVEGGRREGGEGSSIRGIMTNQQETKNK